MQIGLKNLNRDILAWRTEKRLVTETICQLGFRCGQQSSQPATTASRFDKKATRNRQLHIFSAVTAKCRRPYRTNNLLLKNKKEKGNNEQPTHKTAHLQTAQTDTQPKFAKELFSCRRTHG